MPKSRMMGAGLASSTRTGSRCNVRTVQVGNKLQGLAPTTNKSVQFVLRSIKNKSQGDTKSRNTIFCMNQIGGVGAVGGGNRSRVFASSADGVKNCKVGLYIPPRESNK